MIYLFNSGFRREYLVNVLSTMNLPNGLELNYRYSAKEDYFHVEEDLLKNIPEKDQDVLIIFIDRYYENGYRYIPLRKGMLKDTEINEGKMYFKIQLLEYYAVEDIDRFNYILLSEFKGKLPKINPEVGPEGPSDGFFAFKEKDISNDFIEASNAWSVNVERLKDAAIYKDAVTIFTKTNIKKANGKAIRYSIIEGKYRFLLYKNESYLLSLNYYSEAILPGTPNYIDIEMVGQSNNLNITNSIQQINNQQGLLDFHITVNKNAERLSEVVILKIQQCNFIDKNEIFKPEEPINVAIKNKFFIWLEIGLYLLFIGGIRVLIDVDFENIIKLYGADLSELKGIDKLILVIALFSVYNQIAIQFCGNILSAVLTFLLFWRFGAKVS